jgi:hypothetical protein
MMDQALATELSDKLPRAMESTYAYSKSDKGHLPSIEESLSPAFYCWTCSIATTFVDRSKTVHEQDLNQMLLDLAGMISVGPEGPPPAEGPAKTELFANFDKATQAIQEWNVRVASIEPIARAYKKLKLGSGKVRS